LGESGLLLCLLQEGGGLRSQKVTLQSNAEVRGENLLSIVFDETERCLEGHHHLLNIFWSTLNSHVDQSNF
jgi:hypothetical protein